MLKTVLVLGTDADLVSVTAAVVVVVVTSHSSHADDQEVLVHRFRDVLDDLVQTPQGMRSHVSLHRCFDSSEGLLEQEEP